MEPGVPVVTVTVPLYTNWAILKPSPMEIEMTEREPFTEAIADSITEDIMASISDILFAGGLLVPGGDHGLLQTSPPVSAAIASIERTLAQLKDFTAPY